jgi:hypothetical protein
MTPLADNIAKQLARFRQKSASLATIVPQVAGPILGGFAGRTYGPKFLRSSPIAGELLGAIAGGSLGRYVGDEIVPQALSSESAPPAGAPYQIDSTAQDIPAWALRGARFLQPALNAEEKTAEHDRGLDMILGEAPVYAPIQGYREKGWRGALAGTLGQSLGGIAAGAGGLGVGKLLAHALGKDVNVPVANIPLSHLLAGVAGTVGATKGFQAGVGR